MKDQGIVKMRLLRDDPVAPSAAADDSPCRFGLQDNKEELHDGVLREDGKTAFDFTLRVAAAADESAPPVFIGPFAFGRPQDRFVYLSWQRTETPGYVNRIKARLADIDWPLLRDAMESRGVLEADLSGRKAGGGKVPVSWQIVDREPVEAEEGEEEA
jgi:hypothetical protein